MESLKVLIVEDEPNLGESLKEYFISLGHLCSLETTIEGVHKLIYQNNFIPQAAILDINLPDGNGLELASKLREDFPKLPFLFLSAMNDPLIRVKGLEVGAQDYMTKPFDLKELKIRFHKMTKDLKGQPKLISLGSLEFRPDEFSLIDAKKINHSLTLQESRLLLHLIQESPRVIGREEMIELFWKRNEAPTNRTIDNYIVKFRKWLDTELCPWEITTVRGVGYQMLKKD